MNVEQHRRISLRAIRDWAWHVRSDVRKYLRQVFKKRFRRLAKKLGPAALRKRSRPRFDLHLKIPLGPSPSAKSNLRWGYKRPARVGWVERLGERWICSRYNWNLDIFTGKLAAKPRGGSGAFRLLHPYPSLVQLKPEIRALRIAHWSRFGNSVIQLKNLFHMAETMGVPVLEFVQRHPFFVGDRAGNFDLTWEVGAPRGPTIEGNFFTLAAFCAEAKAIETRRLITTYLRPLLAPQIRVPDPRVNEADLVLHFRAGDVFRQSKPPHPIYGQPPLSYYLAAVEREHPARVWLVFEDRSNPCIDSAETVLRERGIEVLLQSGALADDLRLLLSATRLIAGCGSFCPMIAYLSETLRKGYFFDRGQIRDLAELGVDVIIAQDADGEYKDKLLANNWTSSAEQLALMLSYPATKLKFTPCVHRSSA